MNDPATTELLLDLIVDIGFAIGGFLVGWGVAKDSNYINKNKTEE